MARREDLMEFRGLALSPVIRFILLCATTITLAVILVLLLVGLL
jgi:hypothetical protein